ncbi:MAG: hypothetical protein ACRCTQ_02655 [Brevinemataceae bacterium]
MEDLKAMFEKHKRSIYTAGFILAGLVILKIILEILDDIFDFIF